MSKDKTVAFKITPDKMQELGKLAQAKGQTIAGMVRMMVYEAMSKEANA